MRRLALFAIAATTCIAAPLPAATPREILTQAAFQATDKAAALAQVRQAIAAAEAILAQSPADHEALIQRAVGIGYRAKLTRNAGDAKLSRRLFEALQAANPRDPEAQLAVAGWHLDAVADLGPFVARVGLGASRATGDAALDRAVALGGNRAFFAGVAALMRAREGNLASARTYAAQAVDGTTPTALDRVMKRNAQLLLPFTQKDDEAGAIRFAKGALPFGRLPK